MGPDENCEYGSEDEDRFLHAADVEDDEAEHQQRRGQQLVLLKGKWEEAEDGIYAGGDGDRDAQDVIEDERAAGKYPCGGAEHVGGDNVAPSAVGEMLDEPGVGVGDDDHGKSRRQPERETEVGVPLDCGKRFRRPVGRGGKAVRAEPDPREHRYEG